jgi:hypothetical protein
MDCSKHVLINGSPHTQDHEWLCQLGSNQIPCRSIPEISVHSPHRQHATCLRIQVVECCLLIRQIHRLPKLRYHHSIAQISHQVGRAQIFAQYKYGVFLVRFWRNVKIQVLEKKPEHPHLSFLTSSAVRISISAFSESLAH